MKIAIILSIISFMLGGLLTFLYFKRKKDKIVGQSNIALGKSESNDKQRDKIEEEIKEQLKINKEIIKKLKKKI